MLKESWVGCGGFLPVISLRKLLPDLPSLPAKAHSESTGGPPATAGVWVGATAPSGWGPCKGRAPPFHKFCQMSGMAPG